MTTTKKIIRLQGQRRNNHVQMREQLRTGLANLQKIEQKLLSQFGVQNYQDIKDGTGQGVIEEMHKAYRIGGQWDEVLTRHLEEGIEVTIDLSEAEAATEEMNRLFAMINKNIQAINGE